MEQAPFTLKLNERDEVVLIEDDLRIWLGAKDAACAEMCRFLAAINYEECP